MKFYRLLAYFDNDLSLFCNCLQGEYHERGIFLELKVTGKGNDIEVIVHDQWKFIDFLDRFRECLEAAIASRMRCLKDSSDCLYYEYEQVVDKLDKLNYLLKNTEHA